MLVTFCWSTTTIGRRGDCGCKDQVDPTHRVDLHDIDVGTIRWHGEPSHFSSQLSRLEEEWLRTPGLLQKM